MSQLDFLVCIKFNDGSVSARRLRADDKHSALVLAEQLLGSTGVVVNVTLI